jgi:hypothetical protein
VLDEHLGCEGDGEGGVFGDVEAFWVGVDDFLDAGDLWRSVDVGEEKVVVGELTG